MSRFPQVSQRNEREPGIERKRERRTEGEDVPQGLLPGVDLIGHHDGLWCLLDDAPQRVVHVLLEGRTLLFLGLRGLAGLSGRVRGIVACEVLAAVAAACKRETSGLSLMTFCLLHSLCSKNHFLQFV